MSSRPRGIQDQSQAWAKLYDKKDKEAFQVANPKETLRKMYDKLVAALRYFRCDAAARQASDLDDMTYTCSANQHSYHSSDIYHPQKGHPR
ncbi:unnamed protein product [Cladocopium goreaui]|uniref:Uncharacterized protein n=1 Tax=Cladocopium goreaui TaxID=2562237 RepID=A0A9P1G1L1_9DINO|nr:unnamed protein product [Cladocopium goreaui]